MIRQDDEFVCHDGKSRSQVFLANTLFRHAEVVAEEEGSGNSMEAGLNPSFGKPVWIETLPVSILFSLVKHSVYKYLCLITVKRDWYVRELGNLKIIAKIIVWTTQLPAFS